MPATIDEQIANYRQLRAMQVDSLADTDAKLEALLKAKKLLDLEVKAIVTQYDGHENPSVFIPSQAAVQRIQQPDVDVSIVAGCANIPQAMLAWAKAHNNQLDGKELAPVLRVSGISRGKNDQSVMATITNFAMKAHADQWNKRGPNLFDLKHPEPETAPESETVPEPHEQGREPEIRLDPEPLAAD
jgi:hypothetical protein